MASWVVGIACLFASSAQAFVYTSGDLIGVFVDGGSELIVNLGPVGSLSPGATFDFVTPPGFGADGAVGGKFLAFTAQPPFSGSLGRNVTFTAPGTTSPPSFDTNVTGYVARIGLAQSVLDDGGAPDKFLELLNNFPAPPTGGILVNTATLLSLPTSNGGSYTATIGLSGVTDRIDNQLPFEIDVPITGVNNLVLWRAERVTTTTAASTAIGVFEVTGNLGGGSPTARVRFLPEPLAAVPLAAGSILLVSLHALGRRRSRGI